MRQIQEKLVLLRVSGEFELTRVRVTGVQLYFAPKNLKAEYLRSLKDYINGNICLLCLQPSAIFRCR